MSQSTRIARAPQELAATKARNFRTFLLMEQFAAKEIGARIARARELRGLTQEALAEMASFSKRSLQDYEAGTTIPYRHMRELGRLLRRPEEWFLYGDDDEADADRLSRLEAELAGVRADMAGAMTVLREIRRLLDEPPRPRAAAR